MREERGEERGERGEGRGERAEAEGRGQREEGRGERDRECRRVKRTVSPCASRPNLPCFFFVCEHKKQHHNIRYDKLLLVTIEAQPLF